MIRRWFESSPPPAEVKDIREEPAVKEEKKVVVEAPPPAPAGPAPRFGIAKVVEMVNNPHLSGLSPDASIKMTELRKVESASMRSSS